MTRTDLFRCKDTDALPLFVKKCKPSSIEMNKQTNNYLLALSFWIANNSRRNSLLSHTHTHTKVLFT